MAQLGTITWKDINDKTRTTDLDSLLNGVISTFSGSGNIFGLINTQMSNGYISLPPDIGSNPRGDNSFSGGYNKAMFSPEDQAKLDAYISIAGEITGKANQIYNNALGGRHSSYGGTDDFRNSVLNSLKNSKFNDFAQKEIAIAAPKIAAITAPKQTAPQSLLEKYKAQYPTLSDTALYAKARQDDPTLVSYDKFTGATGTVLPPTSTQPPAGTGGNLDYSHRGNQTREQYIASAMAGTDLLGTGPSGGGTWQDYFGKMYDNPTTGYTAQGGNGGTNNNDFFTEIRNLFSAQSSNIDSMAQLIADSIGKLTPDIKQVTADDIAKISTAVEGEFGQYFTDMKGRAEQDFSSAQRFAQENLSKLFGQTEQDVKTSKGRIERNFQQATQETQAALANRGLTRGGTRGKEEEKLDYSKQQTTNDLVQKAQRTLGGAQESFERQWGSSNKPQLGLMDQSINPGLNLNEVGTEVLGQQRNLADIELSRSSTIESEKRKREQEAYKLLNPSFYT